MRRVKKFDWYGQWSDMNTGQNMVIGCISKRVVDHATIAHATDEYRHIVVRISARIAASARTEQHDSGYLPRQRIFRLSAKSSQTGSRPTGHHI